MAQRIAMFNHKGGVGKTLSAYNLSFALEANGKKVLLVDGDSQVNLSALALGDERFDSYYDNDETKKENIKDGVAAVFEGRPATIEAVMCPKVENSNRIYLLPGHADLAEYEGQLSLAQETGGTLSVLQNLPGAINALIERTENKFEIDYTIIDLNPGLGAINQNLFLSTEGFVVPTNPDPFSLMAIGTLAEHLNRWVTWKRNNEAIYYSSNYPLRTGSPRFLGTLNSRFNKHASKAAKKFDERINAIDEAVDCELVPKMRQMGMLCHDECYTEAMEQHPISPQHTSGTRKYALARIPDFQSLVHMANNHQVPIFLVTESQLRSEGLGGSSLETNLRNRDAFLGIFNSVAQKVELLLDDKCREDVF